MATTEQVRNWYHSGVVLNHAQKGTSGYSPVCNHNHPTVNIPKDGGGVWVRAVHPLVTEAWNAYITVMIHHGETMPSAGGVGNCRNIANSNQPSLHAYLCAMDIPPNNRKSSAFITDIEKIRTMSGVRVFRNLAGDRMHDQIDCSPADLYTGIDPSTVIGGEDMPTAEEIATAVWEMETPTTIATAVWSAQVGRGDSRESLASVLVQARNYSKADFLNGDAEITHEELTAAMVDAIEEAGIASDVADELARRLVE